MADDSGEKKHEATDFRRQKAREDGNVARSSDLTSAILLLVGVVLLDTTGPAIANSLIGLLHDVLTSEATLKTDTRTVMIDLIRQTGQSSLALLPLLLGMLATSVIVHFAQVGPLWLPEKLGMDITRIDPMQGFKRLLSITNVTRLGFGLVKIALVTGILIAGVWSKWDSILALGTTGIGAVGGFVWETMIELCRNVAIALVILSIVDYAFQRWKYEQDLRMTDEEMREEMKMTQGDPHTKSRRRKVQRELAQQRLSVDVPKADVVVTNPTELAIALQYDPTTMRAPIVLAKGADLVAAKIRKIALQHGIPIVERKPLAQALFREVDVGKPIPATEYTAVAEVLKYVYQVKGRSIQEITETLQSQTEPTKKDPKRGQPT